MFYVFNPTIAHGQACTDYHCGSITAKNRCHNLQVIHRIIRIQTDEWAVLSGNTADKYHLTCEADMSGRFVYLFAGTETSAMLGNHGVISFATDKYDTWTDTWERLPSNADYPERYGRQNAVSVLDSTTNSILVTGGEISVSDCFERCVVAVHKVEVFRLSTEDWLIAQDETDEIYFPQGAWEAPIVNVAGFVANDQKADILFLLGGGYQTNYKNDISFVSVLVEREYYANNAVIIEGQHPDNEAIESTAFDPWQRFEFAFRIVITEEASVYNVVMLLCSACCCCKKKKNEKNVMPIMLRARSRSTSSTETKMTVTSTDL
eukprot:868795_1